MFLESEGAVIQFAESVGWHVRDGRIYFPAQSVTEQVEKNEDREGARETVRNVVGYARELETIV